jgi:hypothetical protein
MTEPAFPNLFIVGVARGGTTSLAHYLGQHPDIFMSPVKEPYYFSDYYKRAPQFPKERRAYLALFAEGARSRWRGEASTAYFWDPVSAARIKEACPDARILISLRNPADRAYSQYLQMIRSRAERRAFVDAVRESRDGSDPRSDLLAIGFYVDSLRHYLDLFGANVHVLFFEEFIRQTRHELSRVLAFLGVDDRHVDDWDLTPQNSSRGPRRWTRALLAAPGVRRLPQGLWSRADRFLYRDRPPAMTGEERALLDSIYDPERGPLMQLLQRELPWGPAKTAPSTQSSVSGTG